MRNEFKGFYSLKADEFEQLWNNAVFVFDTNVLLNLYRYQQSTTQQLIRVIEHLNDNVWVPYHVALEYQRNRLKVIASQNTKFTEVRKVVSKGTASIKGELDSLDLKKRHSTIEPELFISDITSSANKFFEELDALEKHHFSVVGEDQIRMRLDELLEDKIGPAPDNQEAIDTLESEAEKRFKSKVPPGYMDDDKDQSDEPLFSYGSLSYQRKYSDFLVWSQIVTHAKDKKIKDLIFVTDDNKEDWWLKVRQNGEKTIAPRPELIGEILQNSDVERFHMYSSDGFLKYANEIFKVGVPNEAIEEVRVISRTRELGTVDRMKTHRNWKASHWAQILASLSVSGMPLQLARHCILVGVDGEQVHLLLDPEYHSLAVPRWIERLRQKLSEYAQCELQLTVDIPEELISNTPAMDDKQP